MESIPQTQKSIFKKLNFLSEEERLCWRRRRRLLLSKIPECLSKKIVRVSFATQRDEFEEAFALLYQRYYAVGLLPEMPEKIFFTPYQALPESRVCFARDIKSGQITSTGTLVLDSKLGLPSDCIYKDFLDILRREGRKLAEITCLAARPDIYSRNGLFYVFRLLYKYAATKDVTDLVISIHPKHSEFYELILLFERYGPLRYYPKLVDAPAYLERLNLTNVQKRYEEIYLNFEEGNIIVDFFFYKRFQEDIEELSKPRNFSREIFKYFFLERTQKFQSLSAKFQKYFAIYYDFSDKLKSATA